MVPQCPVPVIRNNGNRERLRVVGSRLGVVILDKGAADRQGGVGSRSSSLHIWVGASFCISVELCAPAFSEGLGVLCNLIPSSEQHQAFYKLDKSNLWLLFAVLLRTERQHITTNRLG